MNANPQGSPAPLEPIYDNWVTLKSEAAKANVSWEGKMTEADLREERVAYGERILIAREKEAHLLFDGIRIDLPRSLVRDPESGFLLIEPNWYHAYFAPLLFPRGHLKAVGNKIFIDPGHGGRQPGATFPEANLVEKDLVLSVALKLKPLLEEAGWEVFMSRDEDRELSLPARAAAANQSGADLFISLHFNAALNREARGPETFILLPHSLHRLEERTQQGAPTAGFPANQFDRENARLAWAIQKSLVESTQWPDRGVRRANFAVLRLIEMPGALVEMGFLSHPKEGAAIQQDVVQQQLAVAIRNGVLAYQIESLATP